MSKVIVRISGTQKSFNKEQIFSILEIIKKRVIGDQRAKRLVASGKTAESLEIQETSKGAQLVGDDSFQQQISGRRPGKFPPIKPILQWIDEKGLSPQKISKKSLAFVIARKMAVRGSDIFLGKRPGLNVKGIVDDVQPTLKQSLVKAGRIEITTAIHKALGQPAKNLRTNN